MKFSDLVNEELSTDYNGLTVYGDLIKVDLRKSQYNDLMKIDISGSSHLRMKSAEELKGDYREEDWDTIEKLWTKLADKYGKKIEKLTKQFEKDLNEIVYDMEKDLAKF